MYFVPFKFIFTNQFNLKVLSPQLQPPAVPRSTARPSSSSSSSSTTNDSIDVWGYSTSRPVTHDFNACCVGKNVSETCLGFCSLKNILDGSTGVDPSTCEVKNTIKMSNTPMKTAIKKQNKQNKIQADFPLIVSCMADGRDHLPCCLQAGVSTELSRKSIIF